MKKSAILFLFCLLTSASSYSQSVYPRAIRSEDGKTIVEITVNQMDSMLGTYERLDESRALNKSLSEEVDTCRKVVSLHERKDSLAVADSTKQAERAIQLGIKNKDLEDQNAKLQRQKTTRSILVYITSTLAAVLAVIAAVK